MADRTPVPALGGVGLIVLCFLGSAALRMVESGAALAQELGKPAVSEATASPAAPDALLAAIREREAQLDEEAARLADRAQTINVAEAKLAEQLAAFAKAQEQLEQTLAMADSAAERDIARMTTVYESMKPEDAARIFDLMDVGFASGLLVRMRPEIAADVLTAMNADSAYAVTLTIASRNAKVPKE